MRRATTCRGFGRDERGVSTTLGYILNLTVATLAITGLLVASGGFVDDQRQQTVRSELRVIGQQLGGDLVAVDELAATADAGDTIRIERQLPQDVSGRSYTITVVPNGGDPYLQLSATGSDVNVRVELTLESPVAESSVSGGQIVIHYVDADGDSTPELEVTDG